MVKLFVRHFAECPHAGLEGEEAIWTPKGEVKSKVVHPVDVVYRPTRQLVLVPLGQGRQKTSYRHSCAARLHVRVSVEEKEKIKAAARAAGCTMSHWVIRQCARPLLDGGSYTEPTPLSQLHVDVLASVVASINPEMDEYAMRLNKLTRIGNWERRCPAGYAETATLTYEKLASTYGRLAQVVQSRLDARPESTTTPRVSVTKINQSRSKTPRTCQLLVSCRESDKQLIEDNARQLGCSVSAFVVSYATVPVIPRTTFVKKESVHALVEGLLRAHVIVSRTGSNFQQSVRWDRSCPHRRFDWADRFVELSYTYTSFGHDIARRHGWALTWQWTF